MRRITNFNHLVALVAVFATIMMVSCFKDDVVSTPALRVESESICFSTDVEWADEDEITRGGVVSNRVGKLDLMSADGEFVLPMGVYVEDGIHTGVSAETRGSKIGEADITDLKVWASQTKDGVQSLLFPAEGQLFSLENGIYISDPEYFWPGADYSIDFVAVSNAPASGFTANMNSNRTALESFTYTVPADATAQNDIVVATPDPVNGANTESVPLNFKHIMTAVNVQIGAVSAGTIESITLKGVYDKGTYNVNTNKWTVNTTSKADYSVKFAGGGDSFTTTGTQTSGTAINADNATFMFIPQEPGAGAVMEIVFNNGNKTETLTGKIEGDIWDKGKTVNYQLSIDKDFTLKVEPDPTAKKLDAHYIITDVYVTVAGNISNWKIKASADDDEKVTIIPYDEANPLAQKGFWTDVEVDENGEETAKSARGESEYSGSGSINGKRFLVFIPENISGKDRQISITLSSTDTGSTASSTKILLQKYPNWTGDIGWEVVDDNEQGKYGFIWDRKVAYVLKYSWNRETGIGGNYSKSEGMNYLNSLITTYSASNYANAVEFNYKNMWADGFLNPADNQNRAYIYIDYSKLNNLSGASSPTEGFNNTKALFNIGGSAASMVFETVVSTTLKTKGDTSDPTAFHKVVSTDEYHTKYGVPAEQGSLNDLSGILTYILKKNRYCLKYVDDGQTKTYHAVFKESDLEWFLPAYNQFPDPTVVDFTPENSTDKAADYWSSTAADGSVNAYRGGDKTPISRTTTLAVIAVRNNEKNISPATISDISTEEMAGGENGEAQWVE